MSVSVTKPEVGPFRWVLEARSPRDPETLAEQLSARVDGLDGEPGDAIQLWLPDVQEGEDSLVAELGFEPYRDLWQQRIALPLPQSSVAARGLLDTRPFREADATEFLAVNNRAFAWHPEQGGMTLDELRSRQAEPWYDADAFLIHERDGRIAGFNWLKVHDRATGGDFDPPMGEIFVIAVDPDFHGLGLGTRLSIAGLVHLATADITRAMLYVEADNHAANRVYERIGFRLHQTNRAYAKKL